MKIHWSILATATCAIALALPLAAATAPTRSTAKTTAERSTWPAETLSGTITMVDPAANRVVVESGGVPFDLLVTPNTRILSGDRTLTLQKLSQDLNQGVSVKFIPERRGDVARSIRL